MKRLLLVIFVLPLSGCMLELLTSTAIQSELAAKDAQSATQVLHQAQDLKAETEANQAIQMYVAEHGQNPPSLDALVPEYLPDVPRQPDGTPYGYDPATGALLTGAAPAPAGPAEIPFTEQDRKNLERLQKAIYEYWQSTGFYPKSLDDLDPLYINKVPKLSSGGSFVYRPKTGAVYHPAELRAMRAAAREQAAQSGTPARPGAPRNLGGITDDYNQRQMRALEQINQ